VTFDAQRSQAERDLARFEALVLSQQPASEPWSPVTDYSFEARKEIEGKHPELIFKHLIPCDDADVLDYGCGPQGHLVRLLREYRDRYAPTSQVGIIGYDPQADETVAGLSREIGRIAAVWDLVICREVLEHCTVREIRQVVSRLCDLSAQFVYITTRFHPDPQSLLDVATHDGLDPTHQSMLNQDLLRVLFILEGFRRRSDLEKRMDWQQKGRVLVYERT
jgi:hypothetical protein